MSPDLALWPTKYEVMDQLNLSLSQINNLIKSKGWEVRMRKRPGLPPMGVLNPNDVQKEVEFRTVVQPHVMPDPPAGNGKGSVGGVQSSSPATTQFLQILERCLEHVSQLGQLQLPAPAAAPLAPVVEKLYLSIAEAAEYSGLPKGFLQQIAADIGFRIGRSWRIPREALNDAQRIRELVCNYGPHTIDDAEENARREPI